MQSKQSKWKTWHKWTFGILVGFIALIVIAVANEPAKATAETNIPSKTVNIHQVLSTEYFDVQVDSIFVTPTIRKADMNAGPGNTFLIVDLTFKNTDKESRMMFDGQIIINSNGKDYTYEQAEIVPLDGYNIIMENVNPMVTKSTRVVYKIPEDLVGTAYFKPSRSADDQKILLGLTK